MIGQPHFLFAVAHRRQRELVEGRPARSFAPGRGRAWLTWWRALASRFVRPGRARDLEGWVSRTETRALREAGFRR
jgi:hypothetical protein